MELRRQDKVLKILRPRCLKTCHNECRHNAIINHFWPDIFCPDVAAVLSRAQLCRKKVRIRKYWILLCYVAGPCLVHCHDGAGRSGVYLLMDANIRNALASALCYRLVREKKFQQISVRLTLATSCKLGLHNNVERQKEIL